MVSVVTEAKSLLKQGEKLIDESERLVQRIDYNKGIVLASTKDFQDSCMSILAKEQMLTKVVKEIETQLDHYRNIDECTAYLSSRVGSESVEDMM